MTTAAPMYPSISLADATELVRAVVKAALADGTLALPDGVTVRVRSEDDSISTSIDFYVGNAPNAWWAAASPERSAFEDALTGIACRYYTPDNKRQFVAVSFDFNRS